jgi:hypothetical protein
MSLIKSLGLNLFLTFVFNKINDARTWMNFSATCRRARLLGKSLLSWKEYHGCHVYSVMPSGKGFFSFATVYMENLDVQIGTNKYTFHDVKMIWEGSSDGRSENVKFINDRFRLGSNDLSTVYVKFPEAKNDDIVVLEPKIIRKEVISELVESPYVKVRMNAKRVIEHRFDIRGHYQQRIVLQKKGRILITRYDEVDEL